MYSLSLGESEYFLGPWAHTTKGPYRSPVFIGKDWSVKAGDMELDTAEPVGINAVVLPFAIAISLVDDRNGGRGKHRIKDILGEPVYIYMPLLLQYITAKGGSRRTGSSFERNQHSQQAVGGGLQQAKHHEICIQITFAIDHEPKLLPQAFRYFVSPTFIELVVTDIWGVTDAERVAGLGVLKGATRMESRILRKYRRRSPGSVDLYSIVATEASIGRESTVARSEVNDTGHSGSVFVCDLPHQADNIVWCLDL